MSLYDKSFSVILPTLNEGENLKTLIPQIFHEFEGFPNNKFEILVVDDNSTDSTFEIIQSLKKRHSNLNILVRKNSKSLPLSILDGIKHAKNDYVVWLDADGSMDAPTLKKMVLKINKKESAVIASRFVEGGGYKGKDENEKVSFVRTIINVKKSKDSVLGMILSIWFNKLLSIIFKANVKDLTSGFIITHKENIEESAFLGSSYGEYFIFLVQNLLDKNIEIVEIGYIMGTRKYGESKTANSFIQLISRGIPYIKAVIKCRYFNNENKR